MKFRRIMLVWAAVLTLAVAPLSMRSQNTSGNISGNVLDTTGASVPDATVTLTNLDNSEKQVMSSNSSGGYSFVNIPPGNYKIQAEKTGFKVFVRQPIVVEIESGLKIDITLPVAAMSPQKSTLLPVFGNRGKMVAPARSTEIA